MPNAKNQTKGKQPAKPLLAFSCLQLSFKALQFNFAIDQFNDHFKWKFVSNLDWHKFTVNLEWDVEQMKTEMDDAIPLDKTVTKQTILANSIAC